MYDVDVFLSFQMHRHLGCDIYLITQDSVVWQESYNKLAEYVMKAVRRSNSISIGKTFTYKFYSGDECFKTKRITKDKKVFGMYRSMVIGEGEKIKSIPLKHILYFVGMIVVAGFIFKFGFMNILYRMNKNPVQEPQLEPEKLEKENNNMYRIIGIIDGHYIVQAAKGFKKPKVLN